MNGYVKDFDSNKAMSFEVSDNKLLKKYNKIWKKICNLMNVDRGRGYGVKKWDYLQITLVPLFLGVIYDPEKGSKRFLEKFPFLAVCRPKNPIIKNQLSEQLKGH